MAVTVVDYDGIHVQLPAIGTEAKYVYLDFKNGRYVVSKGESDPVDDNEFPVKDTKTKQKRSSKVTPEATKPINGDSESDNEKTE